MTGRREDMPSSVSGKDMSPFDRFAEAASSFASKAWFFALCVLLILLWAPSILIFRDIDTWQLIINTATTIITFLLVALLQNSQTRANEAVQHKLNAIADGLADLMEAHSEDKSRLAQDMIELRDAVGLEHREGTRG
ncbi:low affinity iron permease family protein [Catellatospora bangladeshensis]|uniref:Low affinity iron permease family protein n=1 Tax=Catellatospora bangladeshensis TaxID=310355 RepID=A0A8J3JKX9_9ACTN|nr:low affinity iron permease family protein [Catellatospora bangladeshensis]GIF80805.1 hypothetical protein Cba03nite_21540 [Catellatospora bangladeshensis]